MSAQKSSNREADRRAGTGGESNSLSARQIDLAKIGTAESFDPLTIPRAARRLGCPAKCPPSAKVVGSVIRSADPFCEWTEAYYLSTNRARSAWFLWCKKEDGGDPMDRAVLAWCRRNGMSATDAAMVLIRAWWRQAREFGQEEGFDDVLEVGLMDLKQLLDEVWPRITNRP